MSEKEQIEHAIREVLATEALAIPLSERLFSPGGLFSRLATSEEERRALVRTPLFQEAQQRFRELQRQESAEFSRAVHHAAVLSRLPPVLSQG